MTKHIRKHTRKNTQKHKKSARRHKKSTRRHKKNTRSRRGGVMGMFKRDPPCPSPGETTIYIGAYQQDGKYTGDMKVGDRITGVSRKQTKTRLCMANGQGKWVSDDGAHTLEGQWKNDKFLGKIPNPTAWRDRAGNACPGPHCRQPTPPEFL